MLGGDIAGKGLVPIRSHNGSLSAKVRGEQVTVPVSEEGRLRAEINRIGFYSIIAGDDEFERMEDDAAYLSRAFTAAIAEQVEGWCRLAEERREGEQQERQHDVCRAYLTSSGLFAEGVRPALLPPPAEPTPS